MNCSGCLSGFRNRYHKGEVEGGSWMFDYFHLGLVNNVFPSIAKGLSEALLHVINELRAQMRVFWVEVGGVPLQLANRKSENGHLAKEFHKDSVSFVWAEKLLYVF